METAQNFGQIIKQARKEKSYSQRSLAKLIGIDFTYLSKIENNRADYAPKEDVIRALARELDLNEDELVFLAGRIPQRDEELLRQHYQTMPALFRRMRENPSFTDKLWDEVTENKE